MGDPHVERIFYKLKTDDTVSYENAPAVTVETDAFCLRLEKGSMTLEMKEHHATEESARQAMSDYLDAWQIHVCLNEGHPFFQFEFERAEVIDRNPPPPASIVQGSGSAYGKAIMFIRGHVVKSTYPDPPAGFKASGAVRNMWMRFRMFLEGREPLLSMAYACLTIIEGSTGLKGNQDARTVAAGRYNVERDVLKTLGELTSTRGRPEEARKFDAGSTGIPLSDKERVWIQEAVKRFIRRKAEYDYDKGATLPTITMSDLPALRRPSII